MNHGDQQTPQEQAQILQAQAMQTLQALQSLQQAQMEVDTTGGTPDDVPDDALLDAVKAVEGNMGGSRRAHSNITHDPLHVQDPWQKGRAEKSSRTMVGKGVGTDVGPVATVAPTASPAGQPGSSYTLPTSTRQLNQRESGLGDNAIQALLDAHADKLQLQTSKALSNLNCDVTESTQALVSQVAQELSGRIA
eukprot:2996706-Karenia_brevis.AAC.1